MEWKINELTAITERVTETYDLVFQILREVTIMYQGRNNVRGNITSREVASTKKNRD